MKKRHILIGGVALIKGRVPNSGKAMVSICDELDPYFESEKFSKNAPFNVVSLIIRYGSGTDFEPRIGKINKTHSELEVAIEVSMEEVRKLDYSELREILRNATLRSVIAVAEKYALPSQKFCSLLSSDC